MISGAERGKGGRALSAHLLKAENEHVEVIRPRGLGSPGLHEQLEELVALSLGGRTDRPVYHVHADPDPAVVDNDGARALFWRLFEAEFNLASQPFCGAVHVKHGRRHEHRIYSLVRPSGQVVDLAWDYLRRERCARVVEFEFGMPVPTPSKHARAIIKALREAGRDDVAAWMEASGTTEAARPVARLSPQERLIEERTGVPLDDLRAAALAAWQASADGEGFLAALRERGLDLRAGRSGPVVVDATGTAHLATRLIGAAARRTDGTRIPAAAVRERLAGLTLQTHGDGHGRAVGPDHARARGAEAAPGGLGDGAGAGRDAGGADAHRRPDGARDGGGRHGGGGVEHALDRIRARPAAARLRGRLRMLPPGRNAALAEALDAVRARQWIAVPGMVDMWGLPLVEPHRRV
ncbi:relaxase/mobilization nuclease domain-containing protein [Methylorubrum thiocyanatum]|uniref:relaxase/mobilization nuclease domain-containing protein n=1 Tax=Methylorubrum thiocyanatum TaxID=47958 RepID=UPI0035C8747E